MTTDTDIAIETLRAACRHWVGDDLRRDYQIVPVGQDDSHPCGVAVELSCQVRTTCERCGQDLDDGTATGPVAWIDPRSGAIDGGWSHQHGCGAWNTPASVLAHLDADAHPHDLIGELSQLTHSLADQVADQRSTIVLAVSVEVELDHQQAIADLEALYEDDEPWRVGRILAGSDVDAGSWVNGDRLITWAYEPIVGIPGEDYQSTETPLAALPEIVQTRIAAWLVER